MALQWRVRQRFAYPKDFWYRLLLFDRIDYGSTSAAAELMLIMITPPSLPLRPSTNDVRNSFWNPCLLCQYFTQLVITIRPKTWQFLATPPFVVDIIYGWPLCETLKTDPISHLKERKVNCGERWRLRICLAGLRPSRTFMFPKVIDRHSLPYNPFADSGFMNGFTKDLSTH